MEYEDFIMGESRYTAILKKNPELANQLFEQSAQDAELRYRMLKQKSNDFSWLIFLNCLDYIKSSIIYLTLFFY